MVLFDEGAVAAGATTSSSVVVGAGRVGVVWAAGRSWLFNSWDELVVIEVFGSLPVRELRPRKAVNTKMKVSAIFDDLPASSAAFL